MRKGTNKDMRFYRYEAVQYSSISDDDYRLPHFSNLKLELKEFKMFKETPKGYWIGYGGFESLLGHQRWVSKTAKKRYAYPTKEQALLNYIKRTERRIEILESQLWASETALKKQKQ